jgi:hypothetical protein
VARTTTRTRTEPRPESSTRPETSTRRIIIRRTIASVSLIVHIPELLPDLPGCSHDWHQEINDEPVQQVHHNRHEHDF